MKKLLCVLLSTWCLIVAVADVSGCPVYLPPTHVFTFERQSVTWFTYQGQLYSKDAGSTTADLWYGYQEDEFYELKRHGYLFNRRRTASHVLLTSQNSSLPSDYIVDIRFDRKGVMWLASFHGFFASFDGLSWTILPRPIHANRSFLAREHRVWPTGTPFAGDTIFSVVRNERKLSSELMASVPPKHRELTDNPYRFSVYMSGDVYAVAQHPNGSIVIATNEGVHIFRPLAEGEVPPAERLRAAAPYPNPAQSIITFRMEADSVMPDTEPSAMTVDIVDLGGRLRTRVTEGMVTGATTDLSGLEEGVYVAVLRSQQQVVTSKFCIKR